VPLGMDKMVGAALETALESIGVDKEQMAALAEQVPVLLGNVQFFLVETLARQRRIEAKLDCLLDQMGVDLKQFQEPVVAPVEKQLVNGKAMEVA
jgi:hypothetical protein